MISDEIKKLKVSNIFLLPLLKIDRNELSKLGFIDTFLFNGESELRYEDCIYLLFKPFNNDDFNSFVQKIKSILIEEENYDNKVLLTCSLPDKFILDYDLIKEGMYSKTSDSFKEAIINKQTLSLQKMVFQKDIKLKQWWEKELDIQFDEDQELWNIMNVESETFKL